MSERDYAKTLIDRIPESKLYQGAATPDEMPNAETLAAFDELKNGGGHPFVGSTEALFAELLED